MDDAVIFKNLNPQQKEAVIHESGPLLIFAGAGSGKTRVITSRIAYLIAKKEVNPSSILAVTFTKKAAGEMQERVDRILNEIGQGTANRPLIGTFHSIGAMILRKEGAKLGLAPNFSVYDADDSENLVKEIMINDRLDIKQIKPSVIHTYIEHAKNDLVSPEDYPFKYSGFIEDITADIYTKYQKQLNEQNAVDFGDLIYLPTKLLNEDLKTLEKYNERYKYILIDEYQDTNKAQYTFAKLLAGTDQNICVVGDDDQGIYAWRGADIGNILSFEKDFSGAKVIKLEQNYRSTSNVIHAAVSIITQNSMRADKSLWTAKDEGKKITIYQAENPEDEARYVVDEILSTQREGYNLNDYAILYRTNYQSRVIEEELLRRGIPYRLVGGFRFYERKEVKDIISYLRFVNNIKDDLSFSRILNIPTRKVGPKTVSELFKTAKLAKCSVGQLLVGKYVNENPEHIEISKLPIDVLERIKEIDTDKFKGLSNMFGDIYVTCQNINVLQSIEYILEEIRYVEWIDDGSEQAESRIENINELKNVASSYIRDTVDNSTSVFLQEISLIEQEQDKTNGKKGSALTLMTLHSSKGLEFPCVIIMGMEEGILPHMRSFSSEKEMEEERRLCYVGITRAKERLWLTFADGRSTYGGYSNQIPSRFLADIPTDVCEYYSWNG
ncbi:UvrD-helicase domain-containing protein [Candidatus Dojkabacteria bacterium]|nr:UvrD-helicase domain-containing protein [Candidatus Dojkabacteria bacterium]